MASDRARNVAEMFEKILAFNGVHHAEYAGIGAAAGAFANVQTADDALEVFFAKQDSGAVSAAVEAKSLLKVAARRRMREMSRTAKALRFTIPGIEKDFLMPEHDSDQEFVARGRAMCTKHAENEAAFESYGCPKVRREQLSDLLDQIEAMATTKDTAQQSVVGATAGIDDTLTDGLEAATIADAIMRNFYRDDPVTLAEWRTARHIQTVAGNPPPPGP